MENSKPTFEIDYQITSTDGYCDMSCSLDGSVPNSDIIFDTSDAKAPALSVVSSHPEYAGHSYKFSITCKLAGSIEQKQT